MGLSNLLENARDAIADLKRDRDFKKANKERRKSAELLAALMKCRGRLETSQTEFNRVIKQQCRNIRKGREEGMDVALQEQTMWDAALGYLMVRDAIYSLESVNTYDSVDHAYEMLNEAVKVITGKGKPSNRLFLGAQQRRKDYEFLNSASALKEKEQLLDTFFTELEETGDIEACIKKSQHPDVTRADSVRAYTEAGSGTVDELLNRLKSDSPARDEESGAVSDAGQFDSSVPKF